MKMLTKVIKYCPKTGRPVKALNKWIFPIFSLLAVLWVLLRVLPKPQRATYPCMKVAIPMATSFLLYISSLFASVVLFKKAFKKIAESKYMVAGSLLVFGFIFTISTLLIEYKKSFAYAWAAGDYNYEDPLGPNQPIGEAKGIIPGRVVWIHNPDATNENCMPATIFDAYYKDKNANQEIIDEMLKTAILNISGAETEADAWSLIFNYFNSTHNKGSIGYQTGETIFIKINAVHAWSPNEDLSIADNNDFGNVDTSPQMILAVLRQLINKAGVPQNAIYIGDPLTNIFKHVYEKLSVDFPDVNYLSKDEYDNRTKLQKTNTESIKFSDKGKVLDVLEDTYFDCTINANYVLNIPALKGHRGAGITFFAKNHFGTHTNNSAGHMHGGLVKAVNGEPIRDAYKQYRVLVDLMAYEHLGGKTLIYIGDFLWGTSMEHLPPEKFISSPFYNDWSSSILVSLDPVAIASVGLDILQEEFKEEDLTADPPRKIYVHYTGVDDYLHQAASSDWWPDGIVYDPENDGTPIGSLGVHEHWNNATDKQYSRNLGLDKGIELMYKNTQGLSADLDKKNTQKLALNAYLNQGKNGLIVEFNQSINEKMDVNIYNISGQLMQHNILNGVIANSKQELTLIKYTQGSYVLVVFSEKIRISKTFMVN